MSTRNVAATLVIATVVLAGCAAVTPASAPEPARYGLGSPLTERERAGWDIDVGIDGAGLPPGRGSVAEGRALFLAKCAVCHGPDGQGASANRLAGGAVKPPQVVKTVGSFWPYATTVFDYIRRAMPWNQPQSLTADEVYASTAYVLFLNKIVGESTVLDAATLAKVRMPNRDGFTTPDPRPDTH